MTPVNFCHNSLDFRQTVAIINQIEELLGIPVFLVGGAVRDLLLGNTPKDWDLATPKTPEEVEKAVRLAGRKPFLVGKRFGTIGFKMEIEKLGNNLEVNLTKKQKSDLESNLELKNLEKEFREKKLQNKGELEVENSRKAETENLKPKMEFKTEFIYIEITTFRKEIYDKTRKPEVEFVSELSEDLARRDLTINAMAIDKFGQIFDDWNGLKDLENGAIRAVGSPKIRFLEDPLRMLRAIRLAAKLGFEIEEAFWEKLTKMKWEILRVSRERWVLEIDQILAINSTKGLNYLMESGLLGLIIPELSLQKNYNQNSKYHDFDLWTHTLKVVENVPKENLDLRWTALLHDIAKPFVRTENKNGFSNFIGHELLGAEMALKTCNYLKFSKSRTDFIVQNVANHLQFDSLLKPFDDGGKKFQE